MSLPGCFCAPAPLRSHYRVEQVGQRGGRAVEDRVRAVLYGIHSALTAVSGPMPF